MFLIFQGLVGVEREFTRFTYFIYHFTFIKAGADSMETSRGFQIHLCYFRNLSEGGSKGVFRGFRAQFEPIT